MSTVHPAWVEHQRKRWLRPDWQRWMRHDAHRFTPPGSHETAFRPDRSGTCKSQSPEDKPESASGLGAEREDLEHLRWLVRDLKIDLAIRRLRFKYGFNPGQPRDELGRWADMGGRLALVAGPATGRGMARLGASFPTASHSQLVRLDQAIARTENALTQIRRYDPNWKPTAPSLTAPGSIEGAIRSTEARAGEAEARLDQLRFGPGGNLPPAETAAPRGAPLSTQLFDAPAWINAYRIVNNMPDLFGHATWPNDKGTVAIARIDGVPLFGVNSGAPGYDSADRSDANSWRSALISKYPDVMETGNIGGIPNDSLYHAEATLLLRAARDSGGTLRGRDVEVYTDRDMCMMSCPRVLPKLGFELGNPAVTFVGPNGVRRTMKDGAWIR